MDNLTIKEIIKKDLVDDACAVLRWEEFQEKKKKLDKMTVGEIFKQGFGDDAIEIFTQMNINKRNEYYTQRRSFNQIAKYIPKGKVSIAPASNGTGKTQILVQIALQAALGECFMYENGGRSFFKPLKDLY